MLADEAADQSAIGQITLEELRQLPLPEVAVVAAQLRQRLLEVVSQTGGHLAPNLGVVELTLALHRVFESPRDQIIWDVGHQTYVHKLLTGRWDQFATLRRPGGLSGFPRREESPHDVFETGHASTSVSAAVGLAKARDLLGGQGHVIAVIGDGALTGGLAFEALNHLGHAQTRVLVVLNDNSMSIARSVGGLATYLSRARTHPWYSRTKRDLKQVLRRLPGGPGLAAALSRVRTGLKYLLIPGILFEELGLTYLGPVDGHNQQQLESALRQAKAVDGPVIVHCLTRKGQGYLPAEVNPNRFHGIGPFELHTVRDVQTGQAGAEAGPAQPPSFSEAFGAALSELAVADRRICAITAAMPDGTGLTPFLAAHPSRTFDVGIAEQHAVTMAAGLACRGMRPVVAVYSTFLQRAYDQILHDVCLQRLPVVFALDRAGLVGEDGPTHHGAYDLAYMRSMPGMVVAAPRDEPMLRALLGLALGHDGPFALRYPRGRVPAVPRQAGDGQTVKVGRGLLLRSGTAAVVVAAGPLVYDALLAAERLQAEGLDVAVVDAVFVKPLDRELLLAQATRTRRVLTVEDGVARGGLGSAVLELLADTGALDGMRVRLLGLPEQPVPHGPVELLRSEAGLDADGIERALRELVAAP